jgi:hypothetical protein
MLIPLKPYNPSIIKSLTIGEMIFLNYINNDLVAVLNDGTIIGKLGTKSHWQIETRCSQQEGISYLIWAIFKKTIIIEFNGYTPKRNVS